MAKYLSYAGLEALVAKIKAADSTVQANSYAYTGAEIAKITTSYTGSADHGIAFSYSQTNGKVTASLSVTPGTVAEGQTGFITGDAAYQAIKTSVADLAGAMHFRGVLSSPDAANEETDEDVLATVNTPVAGDIVIIDTKEYIYNGERWDLLGNESAYKVIQAVKNDTAVAGQYVSAVSQDANGEITVSRVALPTMTTVADKADGHVTVSTDATTKVVTIAENDIASAELLGAKTDAADANGSAFAQIAAVKATAEGAVVANKDITAASNLSIVKYDAKGLVTEGEDMIAITTDEVNAMF